MASEGAPAWLIGGEWSLRERAQEYVLRKIELDGAIVCCSIKPVLLFDFEKGLDV